MYTSESEVRSTVQSLATMQSAFGKTGNVVFRGVKSLATMHGQCGKRIAGIVDEAKSDIDSTVKGAVSEILLQLSANTTLSKPEAARLLAWLKVKDENSTIKAELMQLLENGEALQ